MEDGYTPALRESIQRVEASRPARLHETWPMMTPAEKQEVLQKFHPDYKPEGMRELRVGPAKGMRTPHELADLLKAAHVTPSAVYVGHESPDRVAGSPDRPAL